MNKSVLAFLYFKFYKILCNILILHSQCSSLKNVFLFLKVASTYIFFPSYAVWKNILLK